MFQSFGAFDAERQMFTPETWRKHRMVIEETADPGCILGPMAQDLIQAPHLLGSSATDVRKLLGEPSAQSTSALVYAIGQCHGWGWHHSELVLSMTSGEVITEASVRKSE